MKNDNFSGKKFGFIVNEWKLTRRCYFFILHCDVEFIFVHIFMLAEEKERARQIIEKWKRKKKLSPNNEENIKTIRKDSGVIEWKIVFLFQSEGDDRPSCSDFQSSTLIFEFCMHISTRFDAATQYFKFIGIKQPSISYGEREFIRDKKVSKEMKRERKKNILIAPEII